MAHQDFAIKVLLDNYLLDRLPSNLTPTQEEFLIDRENIIQLVIEDTISRINSWQEKNI